MSELTAEQIRDLVGEAPLMLEIGCNDGTDTQRFLDAMPGISLYCFEPDPRAIADFERKGFDDRVELVKVALADTEGSAVFYGSSGQPPLPHTTHYHRLEEWHLSGSLLKPTAHLSKSPWVTFPKSRQVTVRTLPLDSWLEGHAEIAHIDFIWMDVQGAEANVLRGGQMAFAATDYIYTEFSDTPLYDSQVPLRTIAELIPEFDLLGIHGENALFRNRHNEP